MNEDTSRHDPVDTRRARRNLVGFFGIAIPSAFFAAFLGLLAWRQTAPPPALHDASAEPRALAPAAALSSGEQATIALFERCSPSVVHIATARRAQDMFHRNVMDIPQGTGTGFVWDSRGYVVTNFHVVAQADSATVTLNDGTEYAARLVGTAPDQDLAVLRIDPAGRTLPETPIGTSRGLRVGQNVYAIGNPFGLDQTLTTGIIGGLDREITSLTRRSIRGVIQTDAAINPGNSGGPLLDSSGRLIGVNTAIFSPTGTSAGIGFAVPVDTVMRVVPQLIQSGKPQRAGLGVLLAPDAVAKRRFGARGAMIQQVVPDLGAARAGLRSPEGNVYDDIVAIDGRKVDEAEDVFAILGQFRSGDVVTIDYWRGDERRQAEVVLTALDG